MSISAISGDYQVAGIAPVQGGASTQAVRPPATLTQGPDKSEMSTAGQLMRQLFSLQKSDPETFKQLAGKISDDLGEAAGKTSDPLQGKALSDLSAKFAEAAQTGTMPDLRPQAQTQTEQAKTGLAGALGHGRQMLADLIGGLTSLVSGDVTKALGIKA